MARKRHPLLSHSQSVLSALRRAFQIHCGGVNTLLPPLHWPNLPSRQRPFFLLAFALTTVLICGLIAPGGATSPPAGTPNAPTPTNQFAQLDPLQQGRELYNAGRYADAASAWQTAANQFATAGDRPNQAMALSNLALAYQQLGQWQPATAAINTALQLARAAGNRGQAVLAQALNTQGSLYLTMGQPEPALTAWEAAAQTYRAIGDSNGTIRSQINQVQAMNALGLYRRALALVQDINQTLQKQPSSVTKMIGLRALGDALRHIGNLDQAEQVLRQSLSLAGASQSAAETTATWLSLGNTLRARQQTDAALTAYQEAATLSPTLLARVQAQLNQLSLLIEQKNIAAATTLATTLPDQLANLPPSHAAVVAQINFAQTLLLPGAADIPDLGIAPILSRAIQQARLLRDTRTESYALGTLGEMYEHYQQLSDARTVTEQALLLAQAINASDITYRWQWQLGRILKAQSQNEGAIAAYTQAVNTLQTLRNDLVAINTDVQFSFRESVEPVYRQLVELLVQPDASGEPSQANLAAARKVIESLQLAELDNFFREACLQATPVQIDRVDPKAAIVYPILLENQLSVILSIAGQPLHHYSTAISREEVERTIVSTRSSLSPIALSRDRYRLPRTAYNWLLRPGEAYLANSEVKTLVFVLDGPLRSFPMSALYDGSQFLIEKYNVALTPGLQLLDPRPLARQNMSVLTGGLTEARQGFSPLPGVAGELQQIAAAVPSKLLLNENLTNANLERLLESVPFNIVHLATHGQFSSNAEETFILTWDDRLKVKQLSTLLQNRETVDTTPLELLVLSACQTASGDARAALGLAGVAVRSGARSTVATLWSVNDEAAAALMTRFYQELTKPGMTKADALRQAQLSLLQDPKFQLPYYWAPFVLVGNWL